MLYTLRYLAGFGLAAALVGCTAPVPDDAGQYLLVNASPVGVSCSLAVRESSGEVTRVDASLCRVNPELGVVELQATGCGYLRFAYSALYNDHDKYRCTDCVSSSDITDACPARRTDEPSLWIRVDT
jgi:hypothetical protein